MVDLPAVRAAVHDAKAAVRFIARHAEEYGVDATRIAAWGESVPVDAGAKRGDPEKSRPSRGG